MNPNSNFIFATPENQTPQNIPPYGQTIFNTIGWATIAQRGSSLNMPLSLASCCKFPVVIESITPVPGGGKTPFPANGILFRLDQIGTFYFLNVSIDSGLTPGQYEPQKVALRCVEGRSANVFQFGQIEIFVTP
jgi:hypothetical protein